MKINPQSIFRKLSVQLTVTYLSVVLLIGFLAHGCANQTPGLRSDASIEMGHSRSAAAYYTLEIENRTIGDATVWFEGMNKTGGNNNTILQVGLQIHNDQIEPIQVNIGDTEIKIQTVDGKQLFKKVESFVGSTSISPKTSNQLDLKFAIPDTMGMDEIVALDLNWTVESGSSRINKTTSFFKKNYQDGYILFSPFQTNQYDSICPHDSFPYFPSSCSTKKN